MLPTYVARGVRWCHPPLCPGRPDAPTFTICAIPRRDLGTLQSCPLSKEAVTSQLMGDQEA